LVLKLEKGESEMGIFHTMFGGSVMMIGMMLFWIVLIVVGFYLLHRFINDRKEELSPMEILKVRLARGEITLDEFEQLSKKL
jgi:putative membrane protein